MRNPFLNPSPLNCLLALDFAQEIHFAALREAIRQRMTTAVPQSINLENMRRNLKPYGWESCLQHPADIEQWFAKFSTDLYQTTVDLYCEPLNRSIPVVHRILQAMAQAAEQPAPAYEATWAICLYAKKLHGQKAEMKVQVTPARWQLRSLSTKLKLADEFGELSNPELWLLIEQSHHPRVVGFALTNEQNQQDKLREMFYETFKASRQPTPLETAGLVWLMPQAIYAPKPVHNLLYQPCQLSGITLKETSQVDQAAVEELASAIRTDWNVSGLEEKIFAEASYSRLFSTYLHKAHGFSPLRYNESRQHELRQLDGFNRDPASLLPLLHYFLPYHEVVIRDGTVQVNGLHYEHPFLAYWPNQSATVRVSRESESRCWVYLDGEIVCEARARELRRQNGTYRDYRNW